MKNILLLLISISALQIASARANTDCATRLSQRLFLENPSYKLVEKKIPADIREILTSEDIACPWLYEPEMNGDKKLDIVVLAENKGRQLLVFGITNKGKLELHESLILQGDPTRYYVRRLSRASAASRHDISEMPGNDFVEIVHIDGKRRLVGWDGKHIRLVDEYE